MAAINTEGQDSVFGHYAQTGKLGVLTPLLNESSNLFKAIVADNLAAVEQDLDKDASRVNSFMLILHWTHEATTDHVLDAEQPADSPRTTVNVKHRTLLMIACYHGSLKVAAYLLGKGASPSVRSPDRLTAYDLSANGTCSPSTTSALVAMLKDAEANMTVSNDVARSAYSGVSTPERASSLSTSQQPTPTPYGLGVDVQHLAVPHHPDVDNDPFNPEGLPYSTEELTRSEYATDNFRMFCFKVLRCSKRFAHDWRECPFAHPTENARRRDPREHRYCAIACPEYKQGFCVRGDGCPYAHGVFECWLHPSRYRTQLCKDGVHCHRPVCFFAHTLPELRTPTFTWVPNPDEVESAAPPAESDSPPASMTAPVAEIPRSSPPAAHVPDAVPNGAQVTPAASSNAVLGLAAPRMSNAFARRHGLNPKDNPLLNLQKIALQAQAMQTVGGGYSGMGGVNSMNGYGGNSNVGGVPGMHSGRPNRKPYSSMAAQQQQQQQVVMSMMMQPPYSSYQGMAHSVPNQGQVHDPAALAALNHHLAALNLHQGPSHPMGMALPLGVPGYAGPGAAGFDPGMLAPGTGTEA